MANLVSAFKVPVREGVNCAIIFAVDIGRFLQQDWSMAYTLRYSPYGADIAMQATPTARPVVTACTICHISGAPLQFLQQQITKFDAPEITNCEMNFTIYKARVKKEQWELCTKGTLSLIHISEPTRLV